MIFWSRDFVGGELNVYLLSCVWVVLTNDWCFGYNVFIGAEKVSDRFVELWDGVAYEGYVEEVSVGVFDVCCLHSYETFVCVVEEMYVWGLMDLVEIVVVSVEVSSIGFDAVADKVKSRLRDHFIKGLVEWLSVGVKKFAFFCGVVGDASEDMWEVVA